MGWFDERFSEDSRRVKVTCSHCNRNMWFPKSKSNLYKTCGPACARKLRDEAKNSRARECKTCGSNFFPRATQTRMGVGLFCSQTCNTNASKALHSSESKIKAANERRRLFASGEISVPKGERSPLWAGGRAATLLRRSKKAAQYKRNNPNKVREHAMNRRARGGGKVKRGLVDQILKDQGWLCRYCSTDLSLGYHIDHMTPVSRGGTNDASNLQALCPPCNLKKGTNSHEEWLEIRGSR